MRYPGGKGKIGKRVAQAILGNTKNRELYLEPFLGAAGVARYMVSEFDDSILSDTHPDLVEMWQALRHGWQPPEVVSREEYDAARLLPSPSALKAFIGFGCSYSGKWFGGYAAPYTDAARAGRYTQNRDQHKVDTLWRYND